MLQRTTPTAERPTSGSAQPAPGVDGDRLANAYRDHLTKVERWAQRLGGPKCDLEDLVQDVFVVAQRRIQDFRGESELSTWLFGITANLARKHRRKAWIREWGHRLLFNETEAATLPELLPLEALERKQAAHRLYRALDRLGEAVRTTVVLFELEELSAREIAQLTGVTENTVWVRVHRGRKKLLELLADGDS